MYKWPDTHKISTEQGFTCIIFRPPLMFRQDSEFGWQAATLYTIYKDILLDWSDYKE